MRPVYDPVHDFKFRRATALAKGAPLMLLVLGIGYAISTQPESAPDAANPGSAVVAGVGSEALGISRAQAGRPTVPDYFPGQYVNRAKDIEEHIQAF